MSIHTRTYTYSYTNTHSDKNKCGNMLTIGKSGGMVYKSHFCRFDIIKIKKCIQKTCP